MEPRVEGAAVVRGVGPHDGVYVDAERCRSVAGRLRQLPVPDDREDTPIVGVARGHIDNFYLLIVAICHQTSPRGLPALVGDVNDEHLRGWDYLTARWAQAVQAEPDLLIPSRWRDVDEAFVRLTFRDRRHGDTLTNPGGRAALIRDLGLVMQRECWRALADLYKQADGRILAGHPNLFGLLSQFTAYRDPVRKKSNFLLALMKNSAGWRYKDEEHLGPPVDYHEVRGHLRLGTIVVRDSILLRKLRKGTPVSLAEDIELRRATYDAVMYISDLSGLHDSSRLHYLFWNIFRSDCTRSAPHCWACPPSCPLPARYVFANTDGVRHCPFSTVCASSNREVKLQEHVVVTELY